MQTVVHTAVQQLQKQKKVQAVEKVSLEGAVELLLVEAVADFLEVK